MKMSRIDGNWFWPYYCLVHVVGGHIGVLQKHFQAVVRVCIQHLVGIEAHNRQPVMISGNRANIKQALWPNGWLFGIYRHFCLEQTLQ